MAKARENPTTKFQRIMGLWAADAKPGEMFVYLENEETAAYKDGRKPQAQAAWNLALGGIVHLVQRKIRAGRYDYIAVRTKAPA